MDTNIQVGIRVRPLIDREIQAQLKPLWRSNEDRIYNQDRDYHFDCVFGQSTDTASVYNVLGKPLVDKAMEGFNGTLFAYGQTASGKTHTIMGDSREPGIVPMAIQDVFNNINDTPNREFLLRASYIEIYNEEITDLLSNKKGLKIRNNVENEIVIDQLMEVPITSYGEAMELIQEGIRHRKIGTTNMNERSSRSHVIFRLVIESRQLPDEINVSECDGAVIVSQLNLVDLAGSERAAQTGAQGIRLKESGFINTSLMTLGLVIRKLSENDGHVPYRDSKLTRILQNSLGGNARTSIICTVSPVVLEETDQTLKFAGRAKNVMNKPKINEVLDGDTMLKRQTREIRDLKRKIRELEEGNLQENILMEKDKMLVQQQKIEEQQNRISKLLKEIVCSGRTDEKVSYKARRQTWCPGGLSGLRSFLKNDLKTNLQETNKASLSNTFSNGYKTERKFEVIAEESFEKMDDDFDTTQTFEKIEYAILKKEFDNFKANTCSPEEYVAMVNNISEKEMECEALKNRIRDMKSECERLRSTDSSQDALEWQKAMELTLEQKVEEGYQLQKQYENISLEKKTLLENIDHLNEKICSSNKEVEQIQNKCKHLEEQQENMVSVDYLEKLKEEVFLKSKELEDVNKKTIMENEELKKTLENLSSKQFEYDQAIKQSEYHEEEVATLRSQMQALEKEYKEYFEQKLPNDDTTPMERNNEETHKVDEISQLQYERDELQAQNAKLLESIGSLNEKYDTMAMEQEKMVSVEYLHQLKAEVLKKSTEFEEANRNCTAENEQLKQFIEELKRDFKEQIAVFKQTSKEIEVNKKEIQNEMAQNGSKQKLVALEEQISLHARDTAQLEEKVGQTTEELELLKTESSEKDNIILSFQRQVDDLRKELKDRVELNSLQHEDNENVEKLQCHSPKVEKENNVLRSELEDEVQKKQMDEEIEKLKDLLNERDKEYQNAREQIIKLEKNVEYLSNNITCDSSEDSVNELNKLKTELNTLHDQNTQLNEDCTSWKSKLEAAKAQIQQLKDSEEAKSDNDRQNTFEAVERANKELLSQIESLSVTKSELENQVYLLTNSQEKQIVDNGMKNKIRELELQLNTLTSEQENLVITADNDKLSYENAITELKCDNQRKLEENVYLKELIDKKVSGDYKAKFEETSCLNEKLKGQLSEFKHEHETFVRQVENALDISDRQTTTPLPERIGMIKDENNKLRDESADFLTKNKCLVSEVQSLKEELEVNDTTIHTLQKEVQKKDVLMDSLSKENLKLSSDLDLIKESLQEPQAEEMQKLNDAIGCVTCERDMLKEKLEESEATYQNQIEAEKKSLEADIATLKDVIESQESEALVLQNAFEKKCQDHFELSQRTDLLDQELKSVRDTNEHMLAEISSLKTETENIVSEKESLQQELTALEEQLRVSQEEIVQVKCHQQNSHLEEIGESRKKLEEELGKKEALLSEHVLENLNLEQQLNEMKKELQKKLDEIATRQSEKEEIEIHFNQARAAYEQLKINYDIINESVHESSCKEALEKQNEDLVEQLKIQSDLKKCLEEEVIVIEEQLLAAHEEKRATGEQNKDLIRSHNDHIQKLNKADSDLKKLREELNEAKIQNGRLEKQLEVEKSEFCKERELMKLAYERRSDQSESQCLEVISSLKKLQAENTRISLENTRYIEQIANVKHDADDLTCTLENQRLNHAQVVNSLTTKVSELTTNYEQLKGEKEILANDLREKEKTLQEAVEKSDHNLIEERNDLLKKVKELQESKTVPHSPTQCNKAGCVPNVALTEKLNRLEYRLKLRQEDLGVYGDRIKEQNVKISQYKAKEEVYIGKIKKLNSTLREMRRPSADASLDQWEKMISELQDTTMKYKKENERLEERNHELVSKNAGLMRNLHNASIRIDQAEREATNMKSKDEELESLRLNVDTKEREIERITEGLKKAFAKMNNSETKRKESESDFECQMKKKDAEIQKISGGLTIAFEKYKHYKGAWQANDQEIQNLKVLLNQETKKSCHLQKKLDEIEKKLRTSDIETSFPINISKINISSSQKENSSLPSNVNKPLVNDLKNNDKIEKSMEAASTSLRESTSNVVLEDNEENGTKKLEIVDRKRKSESPHEGNMRRCKQSPSRKSGENECNQQ